MNSFPQKNRPGTQLLLFASIATVAVLVVGAYLAFRPGAEPNSAAGVNATETAVIPIEGMTCAACVARVRRILSREDGVGDASVSLQTRTATIQYDPERIQPERVVEVISDLGYQVGMPAPAEVEP